MLMASHTRFLLGDPFNLHDVAFDNEFFSINVDFNFSFVMKHGSSGLQFQLAHLRDRLLESFCILPEFWSKFLAIETGFPYFRYDRLIKSYSRNEFRIRLG